MRVAAVIARGPARDRILADRAAESRGLIIAPGTEWFPAEPSGPHIRLNYSGEDPARFPDVGRILHQAMSLAR